MILVLDNHDSFVHNLARYLRRCGEPTRVIRSDAVTAAQCEAMRPRGIVLSPGPKRPEQAGCCVEVIQRLGRSIPILGVCLGHQAIGYALGASICQVQPVHGRATEITHTATGLFAGCPDPMRVARYHSLAIQRDTLCEDLLVTASTLPQRGEGEVVMAVQHRRWPLFGVQFHPESILTAHGARVIENFVTAASRWASPLFVSCDHSQLVP
jgi:anthranilate synthase component II